MPEPVRPPARGDGWDVRGLLADPDARASHDAALTDLENGVTSLWIQVGASGVDAGDLATVLDGVLLDVAPVVIGAGCQIATRVQLLTATHPIDPGPRRTGWEYAKPITIADNVWLGGGVIVCPGVTIGQDTVVGAGAVVTKDLPAGVVAAGVPARVLRAIGEADRVEVPDA